MYSTLAIEIYNLEDEVVQIDEQIYDLKNKLDLLTKEREDLKVLINGYKQELVLDAKM